MPDDEQVVTYSTKELFEKIDVKLTGIADNLGTKAEEVDLVLLRSRVQDHDARLVAVETSSANRKWIVAAIVIPTASIMLATLTLILYKF